MNEEEFRRAMRNTWSLVGKRPVREGALSLGDIRPGLRLRRHYSTIQGGVERWFYSDYEILGQPVRRPAEGDYFLSSLGARIRRLGDKELLSLDSAGIVPYETVEGALWTTAVYSVALT